MEEQEKQEVRDLTKEEQDKIIVFLKGTEIRSYIQAEIDFFNRQFDPQKKYKANPISYLKDRGNFNVDYIQDNFLVIYRRYVFKDETAILDLPSTVRQAIQDIGSKAIERYTRDTQAKKQ